jgi:hypothetical protein
MAPVRGRVTAQGQPVTEGQIMFAPVADAKTGAYPGKAAFGQIDKDGKFELSTNGDKDGAVIGRHEVTYLPVPSQAEEDEDRPAAFIVSQQDTQKEVTTGKNEINFELIANPAAKGWKPRPPSK